MFFLATLADFAPWRETFPSDVAVILSEAKDLQFRSEVN
jgi:hypothetical protein